MEISMDSLKGNNHCWIGYRFIGRFIELFLSFFCPLSIIKKIENTLL